MKKEVGRGGGREEGKDQDGRESVGITGAARIWHIFDELLLCYTASVAHLTLTLPSTYHPGSLTSTPLSQE